MLDEKLEYRQYTYDIENSDDRVQRLKRSTLICFNDDKNVRNEKTIALTGLNRVLTIIARHFLFEVYAGDDQFKAKTIASLKSWLGHKVPDHSSAEETLALYKWLPRYVERVLLQDSLKELGKYIHEGELTETDKSELNAIIRQLSGQIPQAKKVTLAEQLADLCERLEVICGNNRVDRSVLNCERFLYQLPNRRSFNTSGYEDFGEANTVNAITYDRILGNARRAGSLKRYYLACSRLQTEDVRMKSGRKLKVSDWDIVFKLTACCMLELSKRGTRKVQETRTVSFTQADFINWIINAKCSKTKQQSFLYKGEEIFGDPHEDRSDEKKDRNTKWIRLDRHWLKDSEFEILTDDPETDVIKEYLEAHPDGRVFVDQGAGLPMIEIKNRHLQADEK